MTGALPGLTTRYLGRAWRHFERIGSTNAYCKENATSLPHGAAVTASLQIAGKGRLGKIWCEQPHSGLALSVLLHGWRPEEMTLLPLLTGLAVSEGVTQLCGIDTAVKWSNDVLFGARKLCGILCESRLAGRDGFAVVGIGVNLAHSREDLSRLGLVYATSLQIATDKRWEAAGVAAAVLNALEPVLEEYRAAGFEALRARYCARCVTLGRRVRVLQDGGERTGAALDIAPDGALLCSIDGRVERVVAGEASVRGLYGYV